MKKYLDFIYTGHAQVQNKYGRWVPAVPEPFCGIRKECQCGRKFWRYESYRAHYALKHIMGL